MSLLLLSASLYGKHSGYENSKDQLGHEQETFGVVKHVNNQTLVFMLNTNSHVHSMCPFNNC